MRVRARQAICDVTRRAGALTVLVWIDLERVLPNARSTLTENSVIQART